MNSWACWEIQKASHIFLSINIHTLVAALRAYIYKWASSGIFMRVTGGSLPRREYSHSPPPWRFYFIISVIAPNTLPWVSFQQLILVERHTCTWIWVHGHHCHGALPIVCLPSPLCCLLIPIESCYTDYVQSPNANSFTFHTIYHHNHKIHLKNVYKLLWLLHGRINKAKVFVIWFWPKVICMGEEATCSPR